MAAQRVPARRRRQSGPKATDPLDFKARLEAATTIAQAVDDGYQEIERDDRLDYCDMPMIVEKWEIKRPGWSDRPHCRVWAVVQLPDRTEPLFLKFWDRNGAMAEQLIEMERCGTHRNVAVSLAAREFEFNNGQEVGYEFTFAELNPDGMNVPPPEEETPATDEPPY